MKAKTEQRDMATTHDTSVTELLIQADGRILTHNLTPAMADLLCIINPSDEPMKQRSRANRSSPSK
jgi:hypothetical protein